MPFVNGAWVSEEEAKKGAPSSAPVAPKLTGIQVAQLGDPEVEAQLARDAAELENSRAVVKQRRREVSQAGSGMGGLGQRSDYVPPWQVAAESAWQHRRQELASQDALLAAAGRPEGRKELSAAERARAVEIVQERTDTAAQISKDNAGRREGVFAPEPPKVSSGGGGGGGGYVPPEYGWQPNDRHLTEQITKGIDLSPQTRSDIETARDAGRSAYVSSISAEAEDERAAQEETKLREGRQQQRGEEEYRSFLQHERGSQQKSDMQADMDRRLAEIDDTKIDPGRFWSTRNAFQKVSGLIGMALGGFLEGYTHGAVKNAAKQMLDQASADDIAAQKANLENMKSGLATKRSMYGDLVQRLGDEELAEAKLREMHSQQFVSQLDAIAATTKSAHVKMQAAQLRKQFADAAAEQSERVDQLTADRRVQGTAMTEKYGVLPGTGNGGGGMAASTGEKLDEERFISTGPNGAGVYVPTKEEAVKRRDQISMIGNLEANMKRAIEIRKNPTWVINPAARRELHQLQADTSQTLTVLKGQGAMSRGDQEVANASAGHFTAIGPGSTDAIKHAASRLQGAAQRSLEGLPQVQSGYDKDKKGHTYRTGSLTGSEQGARPAGGGATMPATVPLTGGR